MKSQKITRGFLRFLALAAILIVFAPLSARAQQSQVEMILSRAPSQPDVVVDTPEGADVAKCKLVDWKDEEYKGKMLVGPDGSTPYRIACLQLKDKKAEVVEIRFFKNGIEVFRDNYVNGDCRWLGDAGSRWGVKSRGGAVMWKSITPEEATAEAVRAIVTKDINRYKAVALSQADLKTLGIDGSLAEEIEKQIATVDEQFDALVTKLNLPSNIVWGAFNGNHPGLLPKGKNNLSVDLPVYFNAGVILMNPEDSTQSHQINIGDMVKVGDVWKIIGLPTGEAFGSQGEQIAAESILFPMGGEGANSEIPEGDKNYTEWTEKLQQALTDLDQTPKDQMASKCEDIFNLYIQIAAAVPNEQANFIQAGANFLLMEIRLGNYPQGVQKLSDLYDVLKDQGDRELTAFVRLRQLGGEHAAVQADESLRPGDKLNAEDEYKSKLDAFANEYARTEAAAEALMILAQFAEYSQDIDAALNYYSTVAKDFASTPIGQKANGAVRRIGSVGKSYSLPESWKFTDGSSIASLAVPGKYTVLFCWAAWSYNPDDFDAMKKIAARPDVNVIGISLDQTEEDVTGVLQEVGNLPWKNIFVAGSAEEPLNSPTAVELGLQIAPTYILLDETGKLLVPGMVTVGDLETRLDNLTK